MTDATMLIHATGLASNAGMSIPDGTVQRAVTSSAAKLQVLDRLQVEAGLSESVTVHTSSLANSATVTVGLQPISEVARYGHTGHSDASNYTRSPDGTTLDMSVPLPGGASYDFTPTSGWVFSHADLHGDIIATTYLSGAYAWYGVSGPYGEPITTTPDNTAPTGTSRGWHGGDNKITDGAIVHMGARPYSPAHGRFLGVDPVEGGCANTYTYGFGDPVNGSDLTGREWWDPVDWVKAGAHHADKAWDATYDWAARCGADAALFVGAAASTVLGLPAAVGSGVALLTGAGTIAGVAFLYAYSTGIVGMVSAAENLERKNCVG